MNTTNYEELIPQKVLFSIKEIDDLGIIKSAMSKKLLYRREIEAIKIGSKNFFSRTAIIRYLQSRTISAVNSCENIKLSA